VQIWSLPRARDPARWPRHDRRLPRPAVLSDPVLQWLPMIDADAMREYTVLTRG
jgi:hypothetical protein